MFDHDTALERYTEAALERSLATPATKRKYYQMQLTNRLNTANTAEQKAIRILAKYQTKYNVLNASLRYKTFDVNEYRTKRTKKTVISYKDMLQGLDEIEGLPRIISDIAHQPLGVDINKIKTIIQNHAPGYALVDSKVYAKFLTSAGIKMLRRETPLSSLGYSSVFLSEYEKAIHRASKAVAQIRNHRSDIAALQKKIVEAAVEDPSQYKAYKKQFDTIVSVYVSLLENSWEQYLTMAASIIVSLTAFYK